MKVDRRSFFAGAAALGATAPLGGLADEAQGASSAIRSHGFFARRKYDHVVVGGGFAGVAAALASARAGAKTCLLERTNVLGGLSTQGHIIVFMPLCDGYGRQVTFGIPEELLRLPMKYSAAKPNGAWVDKKGTKKELSDKRYELVFDPGPMMLGLERTLVDAGVDIFYDCSAENVVREGTRIAELVARCGAQRLLLAANAFTDATGSAALAQLCGEATVGGRTGNIPCGWYYVVDGERHIHLRCGAGKTLRKLDPAAARDYAGDDPDERSRHAIASRRAILLDIGFRLILRFSSSRVSRARVRPDLSSASSLTGAGRALSIRFASGSFSCPAFQIFLQPGAALRVQTRCGMSSAVSPRAAFRGRRLELPRRFCRGAAPLRRSTARRCESDSSRQACGSMRSS